MRKLRVYCDKAPGHYAAAAQAITDVGMTKDFKRKNLEVAGKLENDGTWIFGAGAYSAQMDRDEYVLVVTRMETCKMLYAFSWPNLRLLSMKLVRCTCHSRRG